MNKMFRNKKRAVSPVIAVVLLIALTVAASAIIWAVSRDLLNTGTVSVTADTTTATAGATATWTGKITVTSAVTMQSVTINNNGIDESSISMVPNNGKLSKGDTAVTFTFANIVADSYKISITYIAEGGDASQIYTFSVTFV